MAQYKVPQDVEADDKLIGPFSFRQFIYLVVTAGLGGIGFLLFRVFPLLVIIPAPFMIFFIILALPIKKDQPMETYLSAVVSFYMKPHTRLWTPGQGETTIVITAPKKTEEVRTKGLSEEEAVHRLSFLADIVDTEGYAIKGDNLASNMHSDFYAEASQTQDIFESAQQNSNYQNLENTAQIRHDQLVSQMRSAIDNNHAFNATNATISRIDGTQLQQNQQQPTPTAYPQPQAYPQIPTYQQQPAYSQAQLQNPQPQAYPQMPTYQQQPAYPQAQLQNPQSAYPQNQFSQNPQPTYQAATPQPTIPTNPMDAKDGIQSAVIIQPDDTIYDSAPRPEPEPATEISDQTNPTPVPMPEPEVIQEPAPEPEPLPPSQEIIDLANNKDFSIETIAQQAKRIEEKQNNNNGEVYISLH